MITDRRHRSQAGRITVLLLATPLAVAGLSACGRSTGAVDIAAVDVTPDQVDTVTFTAQGKSAVLKLSDGTWTPTGGATVQAATMLSTNQDRIFPLNSYRIMTDVNQADPMYGLVAANSSIPECGPMCSVKAVSKQGKTWNLTVGAPTFNKAGFYAKVDGDPRTFLITQQAISDIISEATGTDFVFPENEKYKKVEAVLNDVANDGKTGLYDYDPFLVQVLASQQADQSEKDGHGRGNYVLNAATSTQGQMGATQSKPVVAVGDGTTPQAGAGK